MDFYQVPLGFGMALARNFNAMNAYSAMTEEQKKAVLERAHKARSEKEKGIVQPFSLRKHTAFVLTNRELWGCGGPAMFLCRRAVG